MNPSKAKLIDILTRLPARTGTSRDRRACPDEEVLADYLNGLLTTHARADLEGHLADCSLCTDELVAAYAAGHEMEIEQSPEFLVEKVKGFVPGKKSVFDLVVRLTRDAIELIRASGPVTWPVFTIPIRGDASPSAGKVLQISKAMGRFNITVELEAGKVAMCQFDVRVKDELGRAVEGVRLTLSSEGREQASFLTPPNGEIVFERILPADYQLAVLDGGGLVGAIELSLTREL
jgi:hypothetical protein